MWALNETHHCYLCLGHIQKHYFHTGRGPCNKIMIKIKLYFYLWFGFTEALEILLSPFIGKVEAYKVDVIMYSCCHVFIAGNVREISS